MIEKTHTGLEVVLPGTINIQRKLDTGFLRLAVDLCSPFHLGSASPQPDPDRFPMGL